MTGSTSTHHYQRGRVIPLHTQVMKKVAQIDGKDRVPDRIEVILMDSTARCSYPARTVTGALLGLIDGSLS